MTKPRDFTEKLRICKGCHNEIHPDLERCLVCGMPNPDTGGQPVVGARGKRPKLATGVRFRTGK